jgi:diaminopimelate epimerase
MNLHFLKLRVAADPWILVDRCGADTPVTQAMPAATADLPDWHYAAALLCHPYRGAAAKGVVLVDGGAEPYRVQAWNAAGLFQDLPPAAALCAARWLFDTGRATGETVTLAAASGCIEILVLDSRNFGLALGNPQATTTEQRSPDRFTIALLDKSFRVRLHDGAIPPRANLGTDARDLVQVGCVARHELQLRVRGVDALEAAGAATAAASLATYADRDCSVLIGDSRIMVQWPEGGPMFLAASPAYCLAGDIWLDDASGEAGHPIGNNRP